MNRFSTIQRTSSILAILAILFAVCLPCSLFAQGNVSDRGTLVVFPPKITLSHAKDRQSFVVQETRPDGITNDLTDHATIRVQGEQPLAKIENGFVYVGFAE